MDDKTAKTSVQRDEHLKMSEEHCATSFEDSATDVEMGVAEVCESVPREGCSREESDDERRPSNNASLILISEETEKKQTMMHRMVPVKLLVGLVLAGFVAYIIIDSATTHHVRGVVEEFLHWIEENPIGGFLAFVLGKCSAQILAVFVHH